MTQGESQENVNADIHSDQDQESRKNIESSPSNASLSNDDRRLFRRTFFKTSVHLSSESNFYTGFMNDISEGGLFVATHNIMERGSVVDLEFSLPDNKTIIHVQGEVRWIREYYPGNDGHPGMGFSFLDLKEEDRLRIEQFVKVRDTIFFEE